MPSGSWSTRSTICCGVWRDEPGAVLVAVLHPDAGVEQAEVVVDLGDRADRRARVAGGRLLVDRDRRRQALDEVDVGLVHLPQELAGVGAQRLDVAPLPLGVDRVEGQRRLAGTGQAGEDDQPVAGQLDGDVLEVVLPRPADDDRVAGHLWRGYRRAGEAGPGVAGEAGDRGAAHPRQVSTRRRTQVRWSCSGGQVRRRLPRHRYNAAPKATRAITITMGTVDALVAPASPICSSPNPESSPCKPAGAPDPRRSTVDTHSGRASAANRSVNRRTALQRASRGGPPTPTPGAAGRRTRPRPRASRAGPSRAGAPHAPVRRLRAPCSSSPPTGSAC